MDIKDKALIGLLDNFVFRPLLNFGIGWFTDLYQYTQNDGKLDSAEAIDLLSSPDFLGLVTAMSRVVGFELKEDAQLSVEKRAEMLTALKGVSDESSFIMKMIPYFNHFKKVENINDSQPKIILCPACQQAMSATKYIVPAIACPHCHSLHTI